MVEIDHARDDVVLGGVAKMIIRVLDEGGAAFFDDIVERCGVLKSQCEQALGELAAAGFITADNFAGLRVLLMPASRRRPLNGTRRRRVNTVSLDAAGRWDLIPRNAVDTARALDSDSAEMDCVVRALLNRYGVVFKRVLERETALPPWRYVLWALRRMEARGEVRGGRFVAGFSGEQFALPEAVDAIRKMKKRAPAHEVVALSAADPLNLAGIIVPGLRIPASVNSRVAYVDGEPVALRLGEEIRILTDCGSDIECRVRTALIRQPPARSRRRYARR